MRLRLRLDRLAHILAASRLSQNHWALKLGLSRGHWSDIVNGRHPYPSAKTRQRMLDVFGVSEADLFASDDERGDELDFHAAIAARYEIVQEIGQGGMGTVSLANDRALGRIVAIKVVSREAAAGVGVDALVKEIAFVARLQHPNILPLYEAGKEAGRPYYVMPYVREGSLRGLIERRGRLSLDEALPLIQGVARGLTHAHERQILHCDVKPENLLVQDGHAFVMDFGIARKVHSEALEWSGVRDELDWSAGTPAYVSPEQAAGERAIDQRSDVFSLACVVYEVLSGRAPFTGRTTQEIVSRRFGGPPPALRALAPDLPARASAVLERAMAVDPALRPESARELADELTRSTVVPHIVVDIPQPTLAPAAPRRRILPRLGSTMTELLSDLRISFRSLRRNWRFASGVVVSLALAIGLGVPVLSLADYFFFRNPPGVADPDHVLRLVERGQGRRGPYFTDGLTGLDYSVVTSRATTLESVAGYIALSLGMGRGTDARTVSVTAASASYFHVLGVKPLRGRFYTAAEDVDGNTQPPCVISYRFWQHTMNGAEDAVGRTLLVGTKQYTIVGITPEKFDGLSIDAVDMWLPLFVVSPEFNGRDDKLWTTDRSSWLRMIARVKPGVPLATATADVARLYVTSGARGRDPKLQGTLFWDPLQPGRSSMPNPSARLSVWLSAGGVLLLILVTASLVNLFIARSLSGTRQTAIRLAIGGTWRHLFRLQIVETIALAMLASTMGIALAIPTAAVTRRLIFPGVNWVQPLVDLRVAALGFAIALAVGGITALWSTSYAVRVDPAALLRNSSSGTASASRRAHAMRRMLLVIQASIFAILLTGAIAFVVSLRRAANFDVGFALEPLVAARIALPAGTPNDRVRELYREARDRIATVPGVEAAALAYMEPWQNNANVRFEVPGSAAGEPPVTFFDVASPEYLRTFGVSMRSGRWFGNTDNSNAPPVIVVNESFANNYWPNGGAVGQCVRAGADTMPCRTIIGVLHDFHVSGQMDGQMYPTIIVPVAQSSGFLQTPHLFVRVRGDRSAVMSSVRRALQTIEPNLPAVDVHPVEANASWFLASLRLGAAAFSAFGVLAAVIAALGLYSVLSLLIVEHRRMYAIRLALGGTPARLAGSLFRYTTATVAMGLLIGGAVLLPVAKLIQPMLFHTDVLAPVALIGVVAMAMLIALGAAIGPARALLRTGVMSVLREQ